MNDFEKAWAALNSRAQSLHNAVQVARKGESAEVTLARARQFHDYVYEPFRQYNQRTNLISFPPMGAA